MRHKRRILRQFFILPYGYMMKKVISLMLSASSVAMAGWAGNDYYYGVNAEDDKAVTTSGKSGEVTLNPAYEGSQNTIDRLTVTEGVTLVNVTSKQGREVDLTIEELVVDASTVLSVDAGKKLALNVVQGTVSELRTGDGAELTFKGAVQVGTYTHSSSTITMNFGTNGSLTTSSNVNFGQSLTQASFTAGVTQDQMAILATGGSVTRTLLTGTSNWGIWNLFDHGTKSFVVEGLEDYEFVGMMKDASSLQAGQYALVYSDTNGTDTVSMVVVGQELVPEPATATLSMLALAGLLARRRR